MLWAITVEFAMRNYPIKASNRSIFLDISGFQDAAGDDIKLKFPSVEFAFANLSI